MTFKEFITFLGTKDLNKTSNFYQNVIGLTLYKDQGMCLIFNVNNQSKLGFCKHMTPIHKGKSPIITFIADNVDEIYSKLIESGINIKDKPKINEIEDDTAILTPEGTAFEQVAFTYLDALIAELAIKMGRTNSDLLKKHSDTT